MSEFREKVLKVKDTRNHRITNSLGVYDAYKWLRKNKWLNVGPITEGEYYKIIREVNKALAEKFLTSGWIIFPHKMGSIFIAKEPPTIQLEDGKVKTNLPIDWAATLKLWEEDKESYKNKTLVRKEVNNVFTFIYSKNKAIYNNQAYYSFRLHRKLRIEAGKKFNEGSLDAFLITMKYKL